MITTTTADFSTIFSFSLKPTLSSHPNGCEGRWAGIDRGGYSMSEETLKKHATRGRNKYGVAITVDEERKPLMVEAWETTYPLPGYGNNYGTSYVIDLEHSKRWAKLLVDCWNNTWATRGHGMTDAWTEAEGYVNHKEAREFVEAILQEFDNAEDDTPDVIDIYKEIKDFVVENINDHYDEDDNVY